MLGGLPKFEDENLIVGTETSDDAAIYRLNDDQALIQTVDFFTPTVDDPYTFGQIAAANSLSDIWAMGGEPTVALNIVGFPGCLETEILNDIIAGGAAKVKEAGAVLVGGHTIQDDEPKYGLCVSGLVRPDRIWKNEGANKGDVLVLTKPLGSGIVNTAVKARMAPEASMKEAIKVMSSLNMYAKRAIEKYPISACTDVTGFGLLGHLTEMAAASQVTMEIEVDQIAFIKGAFNLAKMGLVPGGAYRNREFVGDRVDLGQIPEADQDVLFDPQTSGGLLFAIPEKYLNEALGSLREAHLPTKVSVIGRVMEKGDRLIRLSQAAGVNL